MGAHYATSGDCPDAPRLRRPSNISEDRHAKKDECRTDRAKRKAHSKNHASSSLRRTAPVSRNCPDFQHDPAAVACLASVKERYAYTKTFLNSSLSPCESVSSDHLTGAKSNAFSHCEIPSTYPQGASSTTTCVSALLLAAPNLRAPLTV